MAPLLGYWDFRAIGEPIRFLLHHVGKDFREKRYKLDPPDWDRSDWLKDKYSLGLDFPNLPYYIDDEEGIKMTQSWAILRFLAREHGLAANGEEEAWKVDMLEQQMRDFLYPVLPVSMFYKGLEAYKEDYAPKAPENVKLVADFLGDKKWLMGSRLTYVDFLAYEAIYCHRVLLPDILDPHPNLQAFLSRFESLKGIKEFMTSSEYRPLPLWTQFTWKPGSQLEKLEKDVAAHCQAYGK